jgi:hypothetical protein
MEEGRALVLLDKGGFDAKGCEQSEDVTRRQECRYEVSASGWAWEVPLSQGGGIGGGCCGRRCGRGVNRCGG